MKGEIVLVTGGAGFIGRHLVRALLQAGAEVRVIDSFVEQAHRDVSEEMPGEVTLIRGDVRDAQLLTRAVRGAKIVFHLAAEVGIGQSMCEIERYVGANDGGTAALLQLLVEQRETVRKLVVASSVTIYGEGAYFCKQCGGEDPLPRSIDQLQNRKWDPYCAQCGQEMEPAPTPETSPLNAGSVYAVSKLAQEKLALVMGKAYEIPTVALRFSNVYGPGQALSNPYTGVAAIFASRLLNGEAPSLFEDGKQQRDFTHVNDIVQANLLAASCDTANYQAVNVGTGSGTPLLELAATLSDGLGVAVTPEVTQRFRAGDTRHCFSNIQRARDLLGYEPTVSLREGMAEYVRWLQARNAPARYGDGNSELLARGLVR